MAERKYKKGNKIFVCRPTLYPARKILRMRAKYNLQKEGGKEAIHKAIKNGHFHNVWRQYAVK